MFFYCRYLVGLTPLVKDVICQFGLTVDCVNRVLTLFLVVGFRFVNLVSLLVSSMSVMAESSELWALLYCSSPYKTF